MKSIQQYVNELMEVVAAHRLTVGPLEVQIIFLERIAAACQERVEELRTRLPPVDR
jgi:hypothetical protein